MKKAENKIFNMIKSKANIMSPKKKLAISVVNAFFLLSISFIDIVYSNKFIAITIFSILY